VAGAGGTSWSQVELHRTKDERFSQVVAAFRNWGIPTVKSIQNVRQAAPEMTVFASGGLKDGIDIAKCIALGANLGGMAGPFLKAAATALDDVMDFTYVLMREIQICMFASGCGTIADLQKVTLEELK
jgi:isopentenyl-diphosphate Delta-isomerase